MRYLQGLHKGKSNGLNLAEENEARESGNSGLRLGQ